MGTDGLPKGKVKIHFQQVSKYLFTTKIKELQLNNKPYIYIKLLRKTN